MSRFKIASDNKVFLFIPFSNGTIESIEMRSGKSIWRSELGGAIYAPLLIEENKLYVASGIQAAKSSEFKTSAPITIRAISASTGITNWQSALEAMDTPAELGNVYLTGSLDKIFVFTESGTLYCLDKNDGKIVWKVKFDFSVTTLPLHVGNQIYISSDKNLVALSATDGRIVKKQPVETSPTALQIPDEYTLLLGDKLGNVSSHKLGSGKRRWTTWTGGQIASINRIPQGVLVASFDNFIYLLSEKNGKRLWKKRLSGRSVSSPPVREGVAVFSALGGSEALFIELTQGKTVNQISLPEEDYFTNDPVVSDNLVFFSTSRGITAYDSKNECQQIK